MEIRDQANTAILDASIDFPALFWDRSGTRSVCVPGMDDRNDMGRRSPPIITLVVAVAANGVIGAGGKLPWHLPEDLKRFKALTLGKPTIMGRKTWDSLPRKPLPGRMNIVITRDAAIQADGASVAHSVDEALDIAERSGSDEIMVIGGAEIFASILPRASRIQWTEVMAEPAGDAIMPPLNKAEWVEVAREGPYDSQGLRYAYAVLERNPPKWTPVRR